MKNFIAEIETHIRDHQLSQACEKLNQLAPSSIPRNHLAKVAQLAIRAGMTLWAFRLLRSVIRVEADGIDASPEEKMEYAFALIRLGAQHEAFKVLEALSHRTSLPKVHFYLGAIQVSRWNYEEALKNFERYIGFKDLNPYEKRIGQLNFVSCLVAAELRLEEADRLLENLREEFKQASNQLLYANSVELTIQLKIKQKKFEEGLKWVQEGHLLFAEGTSIYSLFFKKWEAVLKILTGHDSAENLLNQVYAEAIRLQHYETLRDCEYHLAIMTQDEDLFNKVYFGTPWLAYRERMKKNKPDSIKIFPRYKWSFGGNAMGQALEKLPLLFIDRLGAQIQNQKSQLKSGQVPHRLLCALTSDFYRPISVAAVFSFLFPDEFYHPESGPKRVHQAIFRLRKWLEKGQFPLEIQEENGSYFLSSQVPISFSISIQNASGPVQGIEAICQKLLQVFENEEFGSQDVAKSLSISATLARQALRWGVENNILMKIGQGPKTRYKKSA